MAVGTKVADNGIVVEELFTFGATNVMIITARIANINIIAIMVDSKRNIISKEVLVAFCTKQILISKTTRTDIRGVVYHGH